MGSGGVPGRPRSGVYYASTKSLTSMVMWQGRRVRVTGRGRELGLDFRAHRPGGPATPPRQARTPRCWNTRPVINEPWTRPAPVPIPKGALAPQLEALDDDAYELFLRAQLQPADTKSRSRWNILWTEIAERPALNQRTRRTLERWKTLCEVAMDTTTGDHKADLDTHYAARKFITTCDQALSRLDRPLAWLGKRAWQFNVDTRPIVDDLIQTIARHRASTPNPNPADLELWEVLTRHQLDPNHGRQAAHRAGAPS